MFPSPELAYQIARMRQEEWLRAAQMRQMLLSLERAAPPRPGPAMRLIWRVGAVLVAVGCRLQMVSRCRDEAQRGVTP